MCTCMCVYKCTHVHVCIRKVVLHYLVLCILLIYLYGCMHVHVFVSVCTFNCVFMYIIMYM